MPSRIPWASSVPDCKMTPCHHLTCHVTTLHCPYRPHQLTFFAVGIPLLETFFPPAGGILNLSQISQILLASSSSWKDWCVPVAGSPVIMDQTGRWCIMLPPLRLRQPAQTSWPQPALPGDLPPRRNGALPRQGACNPRPATLGEAIWQDT